MPVTHYKIWAWGDLIEAGGVFPTRHVGVHGIAKPDLPDHPCALANELICAELGRALRLPIPPGFIVQREQTNEPPEPHFVSLKFLYAGENLPPADVDAIVEKHGHLAAGIVLFDNWVCNADRHDENLAYDEEANRIILFDHSHALMSGMHGRVKLESMEDRLVMTGCCVPSKLKTIASFQEWHLRILDLPEYYVRETVGDGVGLGMDNSDAKFLTDFLLRRREKLLDLVKAHRTEFPKAPVELWEVENGSHS